MSDLFETRIGAAAVAGWRIVVIMLGFIVLQWTVYLAAMHTRPSWLLATWGPGADWALVHTVWFWAVVILKFIWWLMVLAVLWLTLWARQLRKQSNGN
jgi:hypothetical protein